MPGSADGTGAGLSFVNAIASAKSKQQGSNAPSPDVSMTTLAPSPTTSGCKATPTSRSASRLLRTPTFQRKAKGGSSASRWSALSFKHERTIQVSSLLPHEVVVTLDVSGQHTLSWKTPLRSARAGPNISEDVRLPRGSCNLYLYPAFVTLGEKTGVPTGKGLPRRWPPRCTLVHLHVYMDAHAHA